MIVQHLKPFPTPPSFKHLSFQKTHRISSLKKLGLGSQAEVLDDDHIRA